VLGCSRQSMHTSLALGLRAGLGFWKPQLSCAQRYQGLAVGLRRTLLGFLSFLEQADVA
jgi:hypothetical protein